MEAEIQGQKLTEVITKLKGYLKTVAEVSASHLLGFKPGERCLI